jgi:hypothetical protein
VFCQEKFSKKRQKILVAVVQGHMTGLHRYSTCMLQGGFPSGSSERPVLFNRVDRAVFRDIHFPGFPLAVWAFATFHVPID